METVFRSCRFVAQSCRARPGRSRNVGLRCACSKKRAGSAVTMPNKHSFADKAAELRGELAFKRRSGIEQKRRKVSSGSVQLLL